MDRQNLIFECKRKITDLTGKTVHLEFCDEDDEAPSGEASFCFQKIKLKHDWNDLFSNDSSTALAAQHALYYVIGHELGHKDKEPWDIFIVLLVASLIAIIVFYTIGCSILFPCLCLLFCIVIWGTNIPLFSSRLREIRADFCGVLFAQNCIYDGASIGKEERSKLINEIFDYIIEKKTLLRKEDKSDSMHPTNAQRRDYLLNNDIFDERFVMKLSSEYPWSKLIAKMYCRYSFNGELLKLQNTKTEVAHG